MVVRPSREPPVKCCNHSPLEYSRVRLPDSARAQVLDAIPRHVVILSDNVGVTEISCHTDDIECIRRVLLEPRPQDRRVTYDAP